MTKILAFEAQKTQFEKPEIGSDAYFNAIEYGEIMESEAQLDLHFMQDIPQAERIRFVLRMLEAVKRSKDKQDVEAIAARSPKRLTSGKPRYGTAEYWQLVNSGDISQKEAETDFQHYMVRRERAIETQWNTALRPKRRDLPAPRESKQYAGAMSTESARDGRLTPQAKALLQIIRALSGNRGWCDTTKNRLAGSISRCGRSIQRYLQELREYGYIKAEITTGRLGLYSGLKIFLSPSTLPFFKNDGLLAEWLLNNGRISDKTKLSSLLTTIWKSGLFRNEMDAIRNPQWE